MQIDTVMPPSFKGRLTKIIEEIQNRIFVLDDADTEVIKGILKDELDFIDEYYEAEFYSSMSATRNIAYDAGYVDGYSDGYSEGNS